MRAPPAGRAILSVPRADLQFVACPAASRRYGLLPGVVGLLGVDSNGGDLGLF